MDQHSADPVGFVSNRRQRRAAASKARSAKLNACTRMDLTEEAYRIAAEAIGQDNLSQAHAAALMYLVGRFTHMVTGWAHKEFKLDTVRLAYGLECGGGKTLCAMAWIAAVHRLGLPYSMTVAANEVKALCEFKRGLIDFGVPEESIALVHTLPADEDKGIEAATPFNDVTNRQFVLCSHNMIRQGEKSVDLYNNHRDRPRDLVIYDEALLVSKTWTVSFKALDAAIYWTRLRIDHDGISRLQPVLAYLEACRVQYETEIERQQQGETPRITYLPDTCDFATDLHPDQAKALLPGRPPRALLALLDGAGQAVRIIAKGARGAACFALCVPEELKSVFVLDASVLVRDLSRLGSNVIADPRAVDPQIDYSGLEIQWFKHPHGRENITRECRQKVENRELAGKVAQWILDEPGEPRVNAWTFKPSDRKTGEEGPPVNIEAKFKETLRHHHVPLDRVTVLTHGKGRGSNSFDQATHTVFYGCLVRNPLDVAADVLGQEQDLLADLDALDQVVRSEMVYELHQEIARSAIRKIHVGKAPAGRVLIGTWWPEVIDLLAERAFKGCKVTHLPDLDKPEPEREPAQSHLVARSIAKALEKWSTDEDAVSSKKLRPLIPERVGFDISDQVWKNATGYLKKNTDILGSVRWKATARGFTRDNAVDQEIIEAFQKAEIKDGRTREIAAPDIG